MTTPLHCLPEGVDLLHPKQLRFVLRLPKRKDGMEARHWLFTAKDLQMSAYVDMEKARVGCYYHMHGHKSTCWLPRLEGRT
jgi:hypothetical protein